MRVLLTSLVVALSAGCHCVSDSPDVPMALGNADRGRSAFGQLGCNVCHVVERDAPERHLPFLGIERGSGPGCPRFAEVPVVTSLRVTLEPDTCALDPQVAHPRGTATQQGAEADVHRQAIDVDH